MRPDANSPDNLTDINDLYDHLDKHALALEREGELKNLIVEFRNNKALDYKDRELAQWELESFLFGLKGKGIFSYAYSAGKSPGDYQQYPSLEKFQELAFNYLKNRAQQAKNPLLLARYNHLLWRSPSGIRNKKFAIKAIESYLKCIDFYIKQYKINHTHEDLSKTSYLFEILVLLVSEIKDGTEDLKKITDQLLYNTPQIPFYIKHSMIDCMLDAKQVFKPEDFSGIIDIFDIEYQNKDKNTFLWIHNYIPTCLKLSRKANGNLKLWHERLGDLNTYLADRETEPSRFWIKNNMYTSALTAYKNSGSLEKRKKIEQAIFELKPLITLTSISIKRTEKQNKDFKIRNKIIRESCKALLKEEPDIVYENLIEGWYYPPLAYFDKISKDKKYLYEDFLTLVEYDKNKNIKKRSESHTSRKFNDMYHLAVKSVTLQYFYYVFVSGIKSGHLNYENFLSYLRKHTWLGVPYSKIDMGGNEFTIDWIMLIAPSIMEYFVQIQSWQWGNSYFPNFILCIDSLTLKIEGMFRNFSERMNISTTIAGKTGTQEAYTHNILDNEAVIKHFSDDDLQYFKYLFANEGGLNLRNNVAHSYYHFYDYNLDKMHLLLAALIKIAKFQIS